MTSRAESDGEALRNSMSSRSSQFNLDSQKQEEGDLNGTTYTVHETTTDTVIVTPSTGGEQSCWPCPSRDST
ncbi:unnamed protein product [[Candida] boidinii]|nr:unnamed protein product [[Candida] boidinii]